MGTKISQTFDNLQILNIGTTEKLSNYIIQLSEVQFYYIL